MAADRTDPPDRPTTRDHRSWPVLGTPSTRRRVDERHLPGTPDPRRPQVRDLRRVR